MVWKRKLVHDEIRAEQYKKGWNVKVLILVTHYGASSLAHFQKHTWFKNTKF